MKYIILLTLSLQACYPLSADNIGLFASPEGYIPPVSVVDNTVDLMDKTYATLKLTSGPNSVKDLLRFSQVHIQYVDKMNCDIKGCVSGHLQIESKDIEIYKVGACDYQTDLVDLLTHVVLGKIYQETDRLPPQGWLFTDTGDYDSAHKHQEWWRAADMVKQQLINENCGK